MLDYIIANRNTPKGIIPHTLMEYRVAGLRDWEEPTEVRVISALTGKLLRIEQPTTLQQARFNNRRRII